MTEAVANNRNLSIKTDPEMESIMESLLENDQKITAHAVVRLHPNIKSVSTITRSEWRLKLLKHYQTRQNEIKKWQGRSSGVSKVNLAAALAEKDIQIADLKNKVDMLTASHVAMIRAVGEIGGFAKWAKFYDSFKDTRDQLLVNK